MQIAVTTDSCRGRDGSGLQTLESAVLRGARAGFPGIDLSFVSAIGGRHELQEDGYLDRAARLKRTAAENGVSLVQAHAPFYNVLDRSIPQEQRAFNEEMVRRAILYAGRVGVPRMVFHAGTSGTGLNADSLSENLAYFSGRLRLARENGVGIAVENMIEHCDHTKKRSRRRYTVTAEEVAELADALAGESGGVGVCWDFGHANESSLDQERSLRLIGPRLKALHVNDNGGVFDDHLLPFLGTVDWTAAVRTLREIGYRGALCMEVHKFTRRMPAELLGDALRFARLTGEHLLSIQ